MGDTNFDGRISPYINAGTAISSVTLRNGERPAGYVGQAGARVELGVAGPHASFHLTFGAGASTHFVGASANGSVGNHFVLSTGMDFGRDSVRSGISLLIAPKVTSPSLALGMTIDVRYTGLPYIEVGPFIGRIFGEPIAPWLVGATLAAKGFEF